jgi:hypothetical protein
MLDRATPSVSVTAFIGNRPGAQNSTARSLFGACEIERFFEDLDFHCLAPEQPFQFADAFLEPARIGCGDHLVIGSDGFGALFGHPPPPKRGAVQERSDAAVDCSFSEPQICTPMQSTVVMRVLKGVARQPACRRDASAIFQPLHGKELIKCRYQNLSRNSLAAY